MPLSYSETEEFKKDFKKLLKRYGTLEEDFQRMKRLTIELFHVMGIDNDSCFKIPDFSVEHCIAYKVRKFACRCLKGACKSGLRVIYIYQDKLNLVTFIEIYHKSDKANNDYNRLKKVLKNLSK